MNKRKNAIKSTPGEITFDIFNHFLLLAIAFIMLYPFWYVVVLSFNEALDAMRGGVWFWPRKFTLYNYQYVLSNPQVLNSYIVTIGRTVLGTLLTLTVCLLTAYSLSKKNLRGRSIILSFLLVPMFFGGTLASNYIVFNIFGLLNSFWIYVIPGCFSFFYMVIIRTFIYSLPPSLDESARIDGAGHVRILVSIILPLCTPVIATVALYTAVGHWLDFGTNLFFVPSNSKLMVLQYMLYRLIREGRAEVLTDAQMASNASGPANRRITGESIKMATLMVTTLPILMVYPFLQKYFVKGMMVGALKE